MKKKQQKVVKDFAKAGKLPGKVSQEFVKAFSELLSELVKVTVSPDDLREALFAAGTPARPSELKARLDAYLKKLIKGKKADQVRIILE